MPVEWENMVLKAATIAVISSRNWELNRMATVEIINVGLGAIYFSFTPLGKVKNI